MKRTLLVAVALACVVAGGATRADARTNPTAVEYSGRSQGFFLSDLTGQIGTFSIQLTRAENRRYDGVLMSPTLPAAIPFGVTVSASNNFTAIGMGGSFVVNHGSVQLFGDGSWRASADYRLRTPQGTDVGSLVFLRSFNVANPAQLPVAMYGRFLRDDGQTGDLSLRLSQKGSEFQGVAMFAGIPFPFVGTVGAAPPPEGDKIGSAPVHAISVSAAGNLTIDGSFSNGILIGMVKGTLADGSTHSATFELVPAVIVGDNR